MWLLKRAYVPVNKRHESIRLILVEHHHQYCVESYFLPFFTWLYAFYPLVSNAQSMKLNHLYYRWSMLCVLGKMLESIAEITRWAAPARTVIIACLQISMGRVWGSDSMFLRISGEFLTIFRRLILDKVLPGMLFFYIFTTIFSLFLFLI
jgi:hypothetical protein